MPVPQVPSEQQGYSLGQDFEVLHEGGSEAASADPAMRPSKMYKITCIAACNDERSFL